MLSRNWCNDLHSTDDLNDLVVDVTRKHPFGNSMRRPDLVFLKMVRICACSLGLTGSTGPSSSAAQGAPWCALVTVTVVSVRIPMVRFRYPLGGVFKRPWSVPAYLVTLC